MRAHKGFVSLMASVIVVACATDWSDHDDDGGAGGAAATSSTSTTSAGGSSDLGTTGSSYSPCPGDATSTGSGGTGGAGPCPGTAIAFTQQGCHDCAAGACCPELVAVSGDEDSLDCLGTLVPMTCNQSSSLPALDKCLETSCSEVCFPAICDSGLPSGDPLCNLCLGGTCCSAVEACVDDAACHDCITGVATAGCTENELLDAVESCWNQDCGWACPSFADWLAP